MVSAESYRLSIIGACLLAIGGGLLPLVLATPPELYTYSAEQLDGKSELPQSVLDATADQNDSITSIENLDGDERSTFRNAVSNSGNWTPTNGNQADLMDYGYVVSRGDVYEITRRATSPAIKVTEVRGEKRLEVLSVSITELPDRNYFDVRITDTKYEVVHRTIRSGEHSSFTHVRVDNVILRDEDRFYRFTAEFHRNSDFMIWSSSVVFLSLLLFSGLALLVYPVVKRVIRSVD